MEEMQFKEKSNIEFRRDVIRCLIYFLFIFIFFGIVFVIVSTRMLQNIEKQNRLLIDEISRHLSDSNKKRDITDPVKLLLFNQDSITPDPQYIPVEPWPQCEVS